MFGKWMKSRRMVLAALVMSGILTGCSGNVTTSVEQAIDDIQSTGNVQRWNYSDG